MKLRVILSALICAALAAPVIATTGWFPDVPDDHRRIDAIRYARSEGLFLGFPDGNLRPDEELSEGQFVKVAERLYDKFDVWTRADWAQVMYGGLPSLSEGGGQAPVTTAGDDGEGAPVSGSAGCGWPLGEAEPVGEVPETGPPHQLRFPVTPCSPPVTYRVWFEPLSQEMDLPYDSAAPGFTPAFVWPRNPYLYVRVRVTEFRPGGPEEGKALGQRFVYREAVKDRTPTTAPPPVVTTAAAATTTTAPAQPAYTPELKVAYIWDEWGATVNADNPLGDRISFCWDNYDDRPEGLVLRFRADFRDESGALTGDDLVSSFEPPFHGPQPPCLNVPRRSVRTGEFNYVQLRDIACSPACDLMMLYEGESRYDTRFVPHRRANAGS